jgi:hypothetical protein
MRLALLRSIPDGGGLPGGMAALRQHAEEQT